MPASRDFPDRPSHSPDSRHGPAPERVGPSHLSLADGVNLIVAIVIGSAIYFTSPTVLFLSGSPTMMMSLWVLGGLISLMGAFCYAELATTYPRTGGDYWYLTRAYGPVAGFLFGWLQLTVVQTGSIGALAWIFSEFANRLFISDLATSPTPTLVALGAIAAVAALTLVNLIGLRAGAFVQWILVTLKILGLAALIVAGLWFGKGDPGWSQPVDFAQIPNLGVALLLVMYAYGGWNDAGFVAAEIRHPSRNIPRALWLGLGLVAVVYLLINLAYLKGLGAAGLAASKTPPSDLFQLMLGDYAARAMHVVVAISAFSGLNSLILAVARVHEAVGQEHRLLSPLGWRSRRAHTPYVSLMVQCMVSCGLILLFGTPAGQEGLNLLLAALHVPLVEWKNYENGFSTLFAMSAPLFWMFLGLTGLSVLILRQVDPERERPFRVPGYPLVPIVFVAVCAAMHHLAVSYADRLVLLILPVVGVGLILSLFSGYHPTEALDD